MEYIPRVFSFITNGISIPSCLLLTRRKGGGFVLEQEILYPQGAWTVRSYHIVHLHRQKPKSVLQSGWFAAVRLANYNRSRRKNKSFESKQTNKRVAGCDRADSVPENTGDNQ